MSGPSITLALSARTADGIMPDCLAAIKSQREAPDRIILVVDQMPADGINPYAADGIELIANDGIKLYHARNTALRLCDTDLLAFTDTDCVLDPGWIAAVRQIAADRPEVASGTGPHPMIGRHNFASWLHHMWFVVETRTTGYTDGVIGGNAWFRKAALLQVGGWLPVDLMAAEDVYISIKLAQAGWKCSFDGRCIARHHYKAEFKGLMRQSVMMGRDIVLMMKAARMRGFMWYYSLAIPLVAAVFLFGMLLLFTPLRRYGVLILAIVLLGSLAYFGVTFRSFNKALPRWVARWVLVWPYGWGIVKGLFNTDSVRKPD